MTSSILSFAHLRDLKELFPMLTICNCISDADGSRNGPRYCTQDKITKVMYEMRCLRVDLPEDRQDSDDVLTRQQRRLESLLEASQRPDLPLCVSLPIDVYMQEVVSTKDVFLVSVSPFTGLSLGDVIRSGWRLLEERVFDDILKCVEEYGLESSRLPPHRNLNLNAVVRELTARHGAVELSHKSRWVVADWDLLISEEPPKPSEVVSDIEWLLFSAFSKLNVASDADGTLLHREKIESRIMETIERVRSGLSGSAPPPRAPRRLSLSADSDSPGQPHTRTVDLSKAVTMHQGKLREEQQMLLDYRRRSQSGAVRRPIASASASLVISDNESEFEKGAHHRTARTWIAVRPSKGIAALAMPHDAGDMDWRAALFSTITDAAELCARRALRDRAAQEQMRRVQRDGLRVTLLRAALMSAPRYRALHNGAAFPTARNGNGVVHSSANDGSGYAGDMRAGDPATPTAAHSPLTVPPPAADDTAPRGVAICVSCSPGVPPLHNCPQGSIDEQRGPRTARHEIPVVAHRGAAARTPSPVWMGMPRVRQAISMSSPRGFPEVGRAVTRNARRHVVMHAHTLAKGSTPHTATRGLSEKAVPLIAQQLWKNEGVRRSRSAGGGLVSSVSASRGRVKQVNDSSPGITRRRKIAGYCNP